MIDPVNNASFADAKPADVTLVGLIGDKRAVGALASVALATSHFVNNRQRTR